MPLRHALTMTVTALMLGALIAACNDSGHSLGTVPDGGRSSGGKGGGTGGSVGSTGGAGGGTGGTASGGGAAATGSGGATATGSGGVSATGGMAAAGQAGIAGAGGRNENNGGKGGRAGAAGAAVATGGASGGRPGTGGAGGSGSGGSGGAGGAFACSALPAIDCATGFICDYGEPHRCGAGAVLGRCIAPVQGCLANYDPVCGCDGKTYGNDCERARARVQLDYSGACGGAGGAGGSSGCAPCDHASQYCEITTGGAVNRPPSYRCLPLPSTCTQSPSCSCLNVACSAVCMGTASTGLAVTCQVP